MGDLLQILGFIAQETTEKADLRSWQTMPGKAYAGVLNLPPGEHTIQIEYLGSFNEVVSTETKTITVSENETLELVESIYWN